MFSTMLLCVGLLLVASGGIAIALHRSVAALAARVLARRPVPIAQMLHDGPVRIDGTVAAGEQGTLIAPCSGDVAIWFRLRLRNRVVLGGGDGSAESWRTVADEKRGTVVHVADGSGVSAQVDTNEARVMAMASVF